MQKGWAIVYILMLALVFIPPVVLTIIGIVKFFRKKIKTAIWLILIAVLYLVIGFGWFGSSIGLF